MKAANTSSTHFLAPERAAVALLDEAKDRLSAEQAKRGPP
jgi:hypothetical protein